MNNIENRNLKENRLNNWVSLTLSLGIAVSLALIAIGFIILLITSDASDIQPLARLDQIPVAIIIRVGILILLLTPIIQIIAAIVFFSIVRDRLFIGISVAVFCFATIGLVLALI